LPASSLTVNLVTITPVSRHVLLLVALLLFVVGTYHQLICHRILVLSIPPLYIDAKHTIYIDTFLRVSVRVFVKV
jgi:hypothetical protein